jgi:hypothetical protein
MQGEENITMQEMIDKFVIEKGRVLQEMIAEIVYMTNLESERQLDHLEFKTDCQRIQSRRLRCIVSASNQWP